MNIRKYIWAYVVAMALICPGVKAQEQITIGVIQYDVRDIDKSFKALHEQGFGSCELNYSAKKIHEGIGGAGEGRFREAPDPGNYVGWCAGK